MPFLSEKFRELWLDKFDTHQESLALEALRRLGVDVGPGDEIGDIEHLANVDFGDKNITIQVYPSEGSEQRRKLLHDESAKGFDGSGETGSDFDFDFDQLTEGSKDYYIDATDPPAWAVFYVMTAFLEHIREGLSEGVETLNEWVERRPAT